MANRNQLTLIDGSTRYPFTIFRDKEQGGVSITSKEWEPGDPASYWKIPLHPWDGGLASDRLFNNHTYAKANADLSNKGLLVPPPRVDSTQVNTETPNDTNFEIFRFDSDKATALAATSVDVAIPASLQLGDVVIAFASSNDADVHTLAMSGFTGVGAQQTNNNHRSRVFYKIFAGETGNYSVTTGAVTVDAIGVIIAVYKNVSNVSVVDTSSATTDATSPYTSSSITPSVGHTMLVMFAGYNSATPLVKDADFNDLNSFNTTTNFGQLGMQLVQATAAAIVGDFTGGAADGSVWALALTRATTTFTKDSKTVNFDGDAWSFAGSNLIKTLATSADVTIIAVLAASITDLAVFGGELIIGQGYSSKIYKMTTAEVITIATDNTYAGKLAVVGPNLWRSTATNGVSSCTTTPLTLSSWGATYTAGNTSYDINCLIDYAGAIWVGKDDGFYAPDINNEFWNQTPQMADWPDDSNCRGSFTAKGYLWAPSVSGLIRITIGESLIRGPELTERLDYQFKVTGGVQWLDAIFLIVQDRAASGSSAVIKMMVDESGVTNGHDYIYHEWVRLDSTNAIFAIGINGTANTVTPRMQFAHTTIIKTVDMGRGGSRAIDDSRYDYGLSWEFETGYFKPTNDMTLVNALLGVVIILDVDAGETVDTIQYRLENGSLVNMLTTQEGGGTMPINNLSGYDSITRYAASGAQGQFFSIYMAGSQTTEQAGTDRPEIRELWAFGYSRPKVTDLIKVAVYGDARAIAGSGIPQGRGPGEVARLFKAWKRDQTVLQFEMADYEASRTVRVRVADVEDLELLAAIGTTGDDERVPNVMVTFIRDDMAGAIYNA